MMRFFALSLAVLLFFSLTGCGEDPPPRKLSKVTPKVVVKQVASEKKEVEQPRRVEEKFSYRVAGRRDPFSSLVKIRQPLNENTEPDTPLQRFGLKELQLIAVVLGQNEPRAMVVAPDKKAYTLVAGVKVGRNRGQVVDITENKVVVEERYRDFSGALRTELKEIALPQQEGE